MGFEENIKENSYTWQVGTWHSDSAKCKGRLARVANSGAGGNVGGLAEEGIEVETPRAGDGRAVRLGERSGLTLSLGRDNMLIFKFTYLFLTAEKTDSEKKKFICPRSYR